MQPPHPSHNQAAFRQTQFCFWSWWTSLHSYQFKRKQSSSAQNVTLKTLFWLQLRTNFSVSEPWQSERTVSDTPRGADGYFQWIWWLLVWLVPCFWSSCGSSSAPSPRLWWAAAWWEPGNLRPPACAAPPQSASAGRSPAVSTHTNPQSFSHRSPEDAFPEPVRRIWWMSQWSGGLMLERDELVNGRVHELITRWQIHAQLDFWISFECFLNGNYILTKRHYLKSINYCKISKKVWLGQLVHGMGTYMRSSEQRRVGQAGCGAGGCLQACLSRRWAGGGGGAGEARWCVRGALAALRVAAVGTGRSGRHLQRLQTWKQHGNS